MQPADKITLDSEMGAAMGLIRTIGYNLANLMNFEGRATRSQFWPYVAFALFVSFAGMGVITLPEMSASMERMQRFAAEHPDQATVQQGPGGYSITIHRTHPELMPDFNRIMFLTSVAVVVIVFLLVAAVVRRLHDRGRSGAWGLMPIVFLAFALVVMPMLFNQFGQPHRTWVCSLLSSSTISCISRPWSSHRIALRREYEGRESLWTGARRTAFVKPAARQRRSWAEAV